METHARDPAAPVPEAAASATALWQASHHALAALLQRQSRTLQYAVEGQRRRAAQLRADAQRREARREAELRAVEARGAAARAPRALADLEELGRLRVDRDHTIA